MPQQHVFGGNSGVGLKLEHPMAVGTLLRQQRTRRLLNALLENAIQCRRRHGPLRASFDRVFNHGRFPIVSAARLPDRIAPSMVAGRPVSVQSPARTRLLHLVATPGRFASCAGVAANVARRSRTICQGGSAGGKPVARATSPQIALASSSRGESTSSSPALMVMETRPGKEKIHCTVPLSTPRIVGASGGGSMRKCALTMARNSVGTSRPRTRD